jgi:hypothetical protein
LSVTREVTFLSGAGASPFSGTHVASAAQARPAPKPALTREIVDRAVLSLKDAGVPSFLIE